MEQSIRQTVHYFSRFEYPPTIAEVHRYLASPATEDELTRELHRLDTSGIIQIREQRIFLAEIDYSGYFVRKEASEELLKNARSYLTNLEYIPTIRLIGISGSMSMSNGNAYDDIDLFIITTADTIWITRFTVLLYKKVLSWIHPFIGNKLCFNLFFSETGLKLVNERQSLYVGHELLQLKVIFNKRGMYHALLAENNWVYDLFPNAKMKFETEVYEKMYAKGGYLYSFLNTLLGSIQKWWLRKKKFQYRETDGQLWLIQRDWSVEADNLSIEID